MVEFETIKSEEVKFGNNNFIEVARKKAITPEGENEFVSLSRGFFTPDGERRFKRSFAVPDDKDVIDFVADNLKKMASGKKLPKPEKKEKPAEEPKAEKSEEGEEKPTEEAPKEDEKEEKEEEKKK